MPVPSPRPILTFLACGLLGATVSQAQQDAPPVNATQMLKELQGLAPKQEAQSKAAKLAVMQQIAAAAASADGGVTFWETAVKATQMEGASQEANTFRVWKESGEGELFKEKEVQSAVHLYLEWLTLTLQRSAGATVKEMMPAITNYARELWADVVLMQMLDESIKKEKEAALAAAPPGPGTKRNQRANKNSDDSGVRRMHDAILNRGLAGSLIVQWLRLGDYVAIDDWEGTPGNIEGIYKGVIQPELRAEKDQHVFDYWDTKMKVAADAATRSKLNFEVNKYNSDIRPDLLWGRAQEYVPLGQKNRAATEMYNVIKSFPNHPRMGEWIGDLQALLAPPPPDPKATTAAPLPAPVVPVTPTPTAAAPVPAPALPGAAPAPAPPLTPSPGVSSSTLALPGASPGR